MTRIKVGTFNVFNLVAPNVLYYDDKKYSQATYDKKVTWLGRRITDMDVDIVGFQEVFHLSALQDAINASHLAGEVHIATHGLTGDRPMVGLASRFTILESTSFETIPQHAMIDVDGQPLPFTHFSRPVLKALIDIPNFGPITIFIAHLKSKRPKFRQGEDEYDFIRRPVAKTRSLMQRAAEALGLRALVLEEISNNEHPAIVIGDLNDNATAVTSSLVSGTPPYPFLPLSTKKEIWDKLLYNALELQSRRSLHKNHYTHIHNGYYEVLDHIFVSEQFFSANPNHIGEVENVRIFNDQLVDFSYSDTGVAQWQSDHGQVVAVIRLRD